MTAEERIEQCLRAAPKPTAPDGLMDRLRRDMVLRDVETQPSALRRFFAPSGTRVSCRRVAAAAAIAVALLLPLSYGATKLLKRFVAISQLPAIRYDGYGGALSPDGRQFAGVTWDSRLVVIDTSTGEQRNVAENCHGPVVWGADGSEIAVIGFDRERRETLLAVSAKTGKTRTLIENPPWLQDWSTDGKFISGVRTPKVTVHSAVMVDLENKKETVLAEDAGVLPCPRFSPKGGLVSYVTNEGGRPILHLRKIDGTSHVKYMDFPGEISQPLWSPEGSHIVFTGTQTGISRHYIDLWALRVQGDQFVGAPFPVVPDVEKMQFCNWSQNGQLVYRTGFSLGGIFVVPVDLQTGKATGQPRQVTREGGILMHCWSPDGKQIAVRQGGELTFLSAGSGEKVRKLSLAEIEYGGRGTSWSPDGKCIAFCASDREKKTGVFLTRVETGDTKLLVLLEARIPNFDPTWAPDSKTIAYEYKGDVYVANIEDGEPRRITAPKEKREYKESARPVFAPDGKSVAYVAGGARVLATTIDGRETRQIFQLKNGKIVNIFDWSPDGRYIVFTPGDNEIWCAPTDGGEPFQIAALPETDEIQAHAWMPKWSPTGDSIAFTVSREKYQYWVMENLLPAVEAGGR